MNLGSYDVKFVISNEYHVKRSILLRKKYCVNDLIYMHQSFEWNFILSSIVQK